MAKVLELRFTIAVHDEPKEGMGATVPTPNTAKAPDKRDLSKRSLLELISELTRAEYGDDKNE